VTVAGRPRPQNTLRAAAASGMGRAVPAGAHQHAPAGAFFHYTMRTSCTPPAVEDGEEFRAKQRKSWRRWDSTAGKTRDAVHAEFQRAGFFLTHVLECPLNGDPAGLGRPLRRC